MNANAAAEPRQRATWTFHWTPTRVVLLALTGAAVGIAAFRFIYGLGASTNLSNRWPWGLWVWWDVMTGVALAGGGYSTALLVHFAGRERWRAVERGALVTSLLGYLMVCVGLLLDLGRWFNAWRPAVNWGYHSVMFELFLCVSGYTVVQIIEFTPIFFEKVHAPRLAKIANRVYAPVLMFGIILPFLHQSALGSLWIITKGRLDSLWWSMLLPVFFLLSSFFVGPAMVTVENFISAGAHNRKPPVGILEQMLRFSARLLSIYLFLRLADLAWRRELPRIFEASPQSVLFLLELAFGVALPFIMLVTPSIRRRRRGMVTAAALVVLGVALDRANVVFTGMAAQAHGASYFPSWMELGVTIGLVAAGVLLYLFIAENFPVLPEAHHEESAADRDHVPRTEPALST